jgi:integrase
MSLFAVAGCRRLAGVAVAEFSAIRCDATLLRRPHLAKRRGNGEGSPYEYPKGSGIWWAQLPPDANGKRPKRRASSQKEAFALLRAMQKERESGVDLSSKRPIVDALLDAWLEQDVRRRVKASTHESYCEIARLYIRPTLGTRRVDKLTPLEIQAWVNQLADRYTPNVVRNAHARLRAALAVAVRWGFIARNPADGATLPRIPRDQRKPLDVAYVRQWLTSVAEHRLFSAYLAAALLGLRPGEVLGLSWRAYDRQALTITIDQQVQELGGRTVISPTPKSESSRRVLPVLPALAEALAVQWDTLQRERQNEDWREHGLISPTERGTPMPQANVNRHLRNGLKARGLPHWSMHGFRHFTATRLTDLGVQEHVIAAILGHAPGRNVTRLYAKVTIETMRQALSLLEADLLRRAA